MKRDLEIREQVGALSASEADAADPSLSIASARKHYEQVLAVARAARLELHSHLLRRGIGPAILIRGERAPADRRRADGYRLINAFAWANRILFLAAQMVCDLENLPDDGAAEGIVWEVPL